VTPRHCAYINHIMSCPHCYAPAHKHCASGARLSRRYHAEAEIQAILGAGDLASRRWHLDHVPDPLRAHVERICRRLWRRR